MQTGLERNGGGQRGGRGARHARGGGALRNSAGHAQARATPYERPAATASTADKWSHDLFAPNSDLYAPAVNLSSFKRHVPTWDQSSASLRPFGQATPAAQPLIVTATGAVATLAPASSNATAAAPTGPAMGVKGANAAATAKRQADLLRKQQQRDRAEEIKRRKELEAERQKQVKIAKEEELGFVVEVAGLVNGTSAEDVQTAFGAYGEIRFCFILDPNAPDLIARMTFTRHDDAAAACAKLDGAIADGRPLRVKLTNRTPMPAPLPPLSRAAAASASSTATLDLTGAAEPPRRPAPPPSKMYADQIEAAQAQVLVAAPARTSAAAMDVDMAPVPVGPAAQRGRGAPVAYLPGAPPVNPLANRLGPSLIKDSAQGGGRLGGAAHSQQQAPPRQFSAMRAHGRTGGQVPMNGVVSNGAAGSLIARLGVTGAQAKGPSAGGAGRKPSGQQQQRGGGGASLLARLT